MCYYWGLRDVHLSARHPSSPPVHDAFIGSFSCAETAISNIGDHARRRCRIRRRRMPRHKMFSYAFQFLARAATLLCYITLNASSSAVLLMRRKYIYMHTAFLPSPCHATFSRQEMMPSSTKCRLIYLFLQHISGADDVDARYAAAHAFTFL